MTASGAFYDAVLGPLGASRLMDFGVAIGYGVPPKPDFWIGKLDSGDGFRESHIAFFAPDRAAVRAFFDAAVAAGAEVLHEPRVWPEYHDDTTARSSATQTATTSKPSATSPSRPDSARSARPLGFDQTPVVPSRRRPKTPAAEPPDPIQRFAEILRESDERERADRERERLEREAAEDAARAASEHAAALVAARRDSTGDGGAQ